MAMKSYYLPNLLCLSLLLSGCGQTGPLYLPGAPPPIHVEKEKPASPAATEKMPVAPSNSQSPQ